MTSQPHDRFSPPEAPRPRDRYHVALSFASEQRWYVEQVAKALATSGVKYFYDSDSQAKLWGTYLPDELGNVYMTDADAVVMFISREYAASKWADLERRATMSRALREKREYVLPVRFDDTELSGLTDVAYQWITEPKELAASIVEKLAGLGKLANRHRDRVASLQLASPRVTSLLAGAQCRLVAIDDAVVLAEIPRSMPADDTTLVLGRRAIPESANRRWAREELEATLEGRAWDPRVISHLRSRLPEGLDRESSGIKLGLVQVVRAQPDHQQALALELEAWPWWVEREFNRSLLRCEPDSAEDHLARSLAARLFTEGNDAGSYKLTFPSGFYVELAVVDRRGKVLLLGKKPAGSHMAQAGMKWTCSIEEGVKLTDMVDGRIDPRAVALRGLQEELEIAAHDVESLTFGMIALQSRHLNTALLGVATVSEPCELIANRAAAGRFHDFNDGKAIALHSARDLFDGDMGQRMTGTWHATARLRLHLAMTLQGLA